jgi:hypothetical protein
VQTPPAKARAHEFYERLLTRNALLSGLAITIAALAAGGLLGREQDANSAANAVGLMWQVHASFVSIGFAGLAIAFQLLTDPPLAIGSARRLVVEHVRFAPMLALGIGSDLVIGLAAVTVANTITVVVLMVVMAMSLVAVALAYWRMADLYRTPSFIERSTLANLKEEVGKAAQAVEDSRRREAEFRARLEPDRGLFPIDRRPLTDTRHVKAITHDGSPGILAPTIGPLAMAMSSLEYAAGRGHGMLTAAQLPAIYIAARPGQLLRQGTLLASSITRPRSPTPGWSAPKWTSVLHSPQSQKTSRTAPTSS